MSAVPSPAPTGDYLPTPPSEPPKSTVSAKEATVYLHTPFHPKAELYAESRFKKVLRFGDASEEELMGQVDGILLRTGHVTRSMILNAPNLRIIARNGVGYDNVDKPTVKEKGVIVTNCPGGNSQAVAELALTLMLSLLRRVLEIDHRIRSGERVPSIRALSPGLFGKTVALVGMGDTSYELAKLLLSFNCTILAYSPTSSKERWTSEDTKYPVTIPHTRFDSLEEMLGKCDVLSLHCPLTSETRGLIGEKEIGWMKSDAILVNTARGGIVDERALEKKLKAGELGGAGLDVWDVEPPFGESLGELGKMLNVICLPHLGGSTDGVTLEGCTTAIDIMADYFDGKDLRNRVL
ncbi:hypothetical protein CI109_105867 [Kwoniella shandongensis]|uniref:D-3-phosphoglycerate dehydrogenase n=1 Tax=Kwoniella shandongensis TaxID=1734106 RepID=A0A5M6BUR4_9TREE|nr:uncharacterized protein CI109_005698 [Kwoniella shandongensis]KAA5525951.1 hypothetical protein CI109_005698 [Kwoniella shandongensis]